jgi:hypothetical protein
LFAGLAALGWIAERLLGLNSPVELLVNSVAHRGGWIAAAAFLLSVVCWLSERQAPNLIPQQFSEF